MSLLEAFEVHWLSIKPLMERRGVFSEMRRWPYWGNPSCSLLLRLDSRELELTIWESGLADFVFVDDLGIVRAQHFGGLDGVDWAIVTERLSNFASKG